MSRAGFRMEPLGAHDRAGFSCGSDPLDRYFRERASQDAKRSVSGCFVAVESTSGAVAGYYTLSAASVPAAELSDDLLKRLPRYPALPAALIGRLAVDRRFRGLGLGGALVADAALRVLAGDLKALAIIVDAKDDAASSFYLHLGFSPFKSRARSLFAPLASWAKATVRKERPTTKP